MNESKVINYFCRIDNGMIECLKGDTEDSYVTHDDYKALEEKSVVDTVTNATVLGRYMRENDALREELAYLKAQVAELVQADQEFDEAVEHIDMTGPEAYELRKAAMEAFR